MRKRLGKDLDRDVAFQLLIPRAVDLSHAARADGFEDLVLAETGAGGQWHERDHLRPSPGREQLVRTS